MHDLQEEGTQQQHEIKTSDTTSYEYYCHHPYLKIKADICVLMKHKKKF